MALAEQTSAASVSMLEKAREIQDMMAFFEVDSGAARRPAARPHAERPNATPGTERKPAPHSPQKAPKAADAQKPPQRAKPVNAPRPRPVPTESVDDDEWEEF